MKTEIKIPAMGESISEAIIGNILAPSGSMVKIDDPILEIETDKVNQVLYAPQAGLLNLQVNQGETVKIDQIIGFIEGDKAGTIPEKSQSQPPPQQREAPKQETTKEIKLRAEDKKEEQEPSRIDKESFLREIIKGKSEKKETKQESSTKKIERSEERETRRKMSNIRKLIAKRLVEAQQTTAMLTTFNEIDMSEVIHLREKYKEAFAKKYGTKLGFMSFFVKACVSALEAFPDLNSYIDGEEIVHREYYDIGVAVGTDKGVIVPILRNCNHLSFSDIELAIEQYAKKARDGSINVDDLQGGGFTITNGGVYGSLLSTPILSPNQSGILGIHKIEKRPVVIDDQIVIRSMMYVALSYDHRIVDGKEAVSFLVHLKGILEDPARLSLKI